MDPKRPRATHYGAIVGITALGPHVSQLLFLEPSTNSNLKAYSRLLLPDMESSDSVVRHEALKCYGALLDAVSAFFVRLEPFFRKGATVLERQDPKQENGTGATERQPRNPDQMEDDEDGDGQNPQAPKEDSGRRATEELTKSLRERMNAVSVPPDILERYLEMYELFGESVLPFIYYDVQPQTEEDPGDKAGPKSLAMEMFL